MGRYFKERGYFLTNPEALSRRFGASAHSSSRGTHGVVGLRGTGDMEGEGQFDGHRSRQRGSQSATGAPWRCSTAVLSGCLEACSPSDGSIPGVLGIQPAFDVVADRLFGVLRAGPVARCSAKT